MKTKEQLIDDLLSLAFAEDIGDGDHTTLSTIPATARGRQRLIIKEEGIIAGVEVVWEVHKFGLILQKNLQLMKCLRLFV